MGLIKDYKKYQIRKIIVEILSEYGITQEDLKYLPEALKTVKNNQFVKHNELTDKEKEKIKQSYEGKVTPNDFVEMFANDVEEFYPNGKPEKHNN